MQLIIGIWREKMSSTQRIKTRVTKAPQQLRHALKLPRFYYDLTFAAILH